MASSKSSRNIGGHLGIGDLAEEWKCRLLGISIATGTGSLLEDRTLVRLNERAMESSAAKVHFAVDASVVFTNR
jgi:hypothetical protein